jgi:hypothetical protein
MACWAQTPRIPSGEELLVQWANGNNAGRIEQFLEPHSPVVIIFFGRVRESVVKPAIRASPSVFVEAKNGVQKSADCSGVAEYVSRARNCSSRRIS